MSDTIIKILKENIRKTEADLAHWNIEVKKRYDALTEATKMSTILQAGLELLKQQLESVNGGT